jgi:hypothetical protein
MKGQIAEAFGDLMREIWIEDNNAVAPFEFKRVLGKSIFKWQMTR